MAEARSVEVAKLLADIDVLMKQLDDASPVYWDGFCAGDQVSFYEDDTPEQIRAKSALINAREAKVKSLIRKIDEKYERIEQLKRSCSKTGNGVYQGPFAFTITKSPKDSYSIGDMLAAVRKVMRQKSIIVVKYAWYYEDKGMDNEGNPIHPHIHGMYETVSGGRIEKKHWKRAWPIWDESVPCGQGFRGGYHRPVRHDEGYSNYIKKDGRMHEEFGLVDEQTE